MAEPARMSARTLTQVYSTYSTPGHQGVHNASTLESLTESLRLLLDALELCQQQPS